MQKPAAVFDRVQGLGNIIDIIKTITGLVDVTKLPNIIAKYKALDAITDPVNTPDGVKKRVVAGLELVVAIAEATKTPADDGLVAFVNGILTNDTVLNLIAKVISGWMRSNAPKAEAVPEVVGFDPVTLFTIIKFIYDLIMKLLNKTTAEGCGPDCDCH